MILPFLLVLVGLLALQPTCYADDDTTYKINKLRNHDEVPHVNIKVFRGPNKEKDGEQFASWGYWFKQPSQP